MSSRHRCRATPALDITLRISAVNETLVVSAAQIDQPLSRTPRQRHGDPRSRDRGEAAIHARPRRCDRCRASRCSRTADRARVTSLFTRGGESDYTLVLVDGVRANAFGGGLDLSQVPLQDVERIEVVRGSQSALYGSDAIGGVIQVITRSGGKPSAQAQVEAGSRDMRRGSAATTGRGERRALAARRQLFRRRRLHWYWRRTGKPCRNDDAQETQASRLARLAACSRAARICKGIVQYVDTERGSPGAVRIGSGPALSPASTRCREARPSASAAGCAGCNRGSAPAAASVSASSSTSPTTTSPSRASSAPRKATRIVRTRACRPTSRRPPSSGSQAASSGSASAAAARSSPPAPPAAIPVERGVLGVFGEAPMECRPIARPSPPAFAASASRATRCLAIRSRSRRARIFLRKRSPR